MNQQQVEFENLIAACADAVDAAFTNEVMASMRGVSADRTFAEIVRPFIVRAYEQGVQDKAKNVMTDGKHNVLSPGPFSNDRSFPMSGQ